MAMDAIRAVIVEGRWHVQRSFSANADVPWMPAADSNRPNRPASKVRIAIEYQDNVRPYACTITGSPTLTML